MKKGGRKSTADLAVITPSTGQAPQPPKHLNKAAKDIWLDVTSTKPWDWFTAENTPLLEAYCQCVVRYRTIGRRLQKLSAAHLQTPEDIDMNDKLLKMSDRESKLMASLATKMRLTQQARYTTQAAGTANKGHARKAPWMK